jgi:4'-phosphopantetheinyl transferase
MSAVPEVHIWYRSTESVDSDTLLLADQALSPVERARRDCFRFPEDRRDYTIAHDLLRRCLSRYAPVPPSAWMFSANAYGKPTISAPTPEVGCAPLSFNLAHTRGFVACAITFSNAVGVDVERLGRRIDGTALADRYFTALEAASLRTWPEEERGARFLELWTLKEAFVKATGLGLSHALDRFSFTLAEKGTLLITRPLGDDTARWQAALFGPSDDVRLAVVVRVSEPGQVRFTARAADGGDGVAISPLAVTRAAS